MALSAQNGSERVRQLITLTVRLGERLERESGILEAHRPQDLYDGLEETRNLSNLYRHECMRIRMDPTLLGGISTAEKQALKTATELFNERLQRYEHAVGAAKTVAEGIIAAVAQDLSAAKNQSATYGPRAQANTAGPQSLNFGGVA